MSQQQFTDFSLKPILPMSKEMIAPVHFNSEQHACTRVKLNAEITNHITPVNVTMWINNDGQNKSDIVKITPFHIIIRWTGGKNDGDILYIKDLVEKRLGVGVFFRRKTNEPFIWSGLVYSVVDRVENGIRVVYLYVLKDSATGQLFVPARFGLKEREFKLAARLGMGYLEYQ